MNVKRNHKQAKVRTSWEPVADWYDGWMGEAGSKHHQQLAIPALLKLLNPDAHDRVVDVGSGQGVLAPHIVAAGASYVGVEASGKLVRRAQQHHADLAATFLQGDARRLGQVTNGRFTAAVFLLSIQDMNPLQAVLAAVAEVLGQNGRLILLITHPCFRIPRQSGWGWDEQRKLRYRRVDSYLTRLAVPMKAYKAKRKTAPQGYATTRSYHRPLQDYINGLSTCGFMIDQIDEIPAGELAGKRADKRAKTEIPLFLGIRAIKMR